MYVIPPMIVTDGNLVSASIPENDYAEWNDEDAMFAYTVGDRVIVLSNHSVYECILDHTNKNPLTNPTYWLRVGATNRWKAFDRKINQQAAPLSGDTGYISYVFAPGTFTNSAALLNVTGTVARVTVRDALDVVVHEEERDLIDTSGITDWLEYYTWAGDTFATEALFLELPCFTGHTLEVEIEADPNAAVGQIILGKVTYLGDTESGTSAGFVDYSTKEQDVFGDAVIVQRPFARRNIFAVAIREDDEARVLRILSNLRATPALYYAAPDTENRGTLIYGWVNDLDIPLTTGVSKATVEITGLT